MTILLIFISSPFGFWREKNWRPLSERYQSFSLVFINPDIYLFIFSKTLSGEYWTKANVNSFSQAALFLVQWERLRSSQLSLCRLPLIGSLFGGKKYIWEIFSWSRKFDILIPRSRGRLIVLWIIHTFNSAYFSAFYIFIHLFKNFIGWALKRTVLAKQLSFSSSENAWVNFLRSSQLSLCRLPLIGSLFGQKKIYERFLVGAGSSICWFQEVEED